MACVCELHHSIRSLQCLCKLRYTVCTGITWNWQHIIPINLYLNFPYAESIHILYVAYSTVFGRAEINLTSQKPPPHSGTVLPHLAGVLPWLCLSITQRSIGLMRVSLLMNAAIALITSSAELTHRHGHDGVWSWCDGKAGSPSIVVSSYRLILLSVAL